MVSRVAQYAALCKGPLLDETLQVPRRRCSGRAGDADIVLSAQAALETVDPLPEHAGNCFLLPFVQVPPQAFIELGLRNVEIHALERVLLRVENRVGKVGQPASDFVVLVVALKRGVIVLAPALDRVGQSDQARLPEVLRQRFFRKRPADCRPRTDEWIQSGGDRCRHG
jgi:hypothetical protein